jgi:hypothetical protein
MKNRFNHQLMFVLAAVGLTGSGWAQLPREFETYVPEEPLGYCLYTYDGRANVNLDVPEAPGGKVTGQELFAAASVPLFRNRALTLAAGFGFQWNRFEFSAIPLADADLYALTVPLDVMYTGLERWTFWLNATPGVFSDLKHVNGDDYRTLAHGLVLYRLLAQLQLAAGASYDREFGDDKLYPIGGVVWDIDRHWRLNALFPAPLLQYAPTPRWVFFANARPAGNKWNLHITDNSRDGDFKLESWQLGLGAEVEVVRHLWLSLSGGLDLDRSYEVRDADFRLKSKAGETWFARAGFVVR